MITKEQICSICYDYIIPKWHSTSEQFPSFLQSFTPEEKSANETFFEELLPDFRKSIAAYQQEPSDEVKAQMQLKMEKVLQTENILHIREHISKELFAQFEQNIETFVERTKAFDETLSSENIWQAMRNFLIYSMIVNLQGQQQNCRDTILGYSLLYPYTDNYIDELHRKSTEKSSYNNLIRKTLMGENITPANTYETKTKQLLNLVLDSYPKDSLPQKETAFLLLLMLEAQEKSLLQIHRFGLKKLSTDEILRISTYKGGISVLIDYLFSIDFDTSAVTQEEFLFYLSFGLILQLADDLQDLTEDKKNHSQTMITSCKNRKQLETTVNRLLHFTQTVISNFAPKNPELHTFTLQNCQLMLLAAVAQNANHFSKSYIKRLEQHLPFSISFLQKMQKTTF